MRCSPLLVSVLLVWATCAAAAPKEYTPAEILKQYEKSERGEEAVNEDIIVTGKVTRVQPNFGMSVVSLQADGLKEVLVRVGVPEVWTTIVPGQEVKLRVVAPTKVRIATARLRKGKEKQVVGVVYAGEGKVVDAGKYLASATKAEEFMKQYNADRRAMAEEHDGKFFALDGEVVEVVSGGPDKRAHVVIKGAGDRNIGLHYSQDYEEYTAKLKPKQRVKFVGAASLLESLSSDSPKLIWLDGDFVTRTRN